MSSIKNLEKRDIMGILEIVNEERTKDERCSSSSKRQKQAECWRDPVSWKLRFLEREREWLLSRFPADRTICSRRIKKESCSTRQGVRVGTNLV